MAQRNTCPCRIGRPWSWPRWIGARSKIIKPGAAGWCERERSRTGNQPRASEPMIMSPVVAVTANRSRCSCAAISRNGPLGRLPDVTKPPFELVIQQHGATVFRVCRAVLGSVDAQDAWSETFMAALRAYPDLPADANVQAWLVTIAHRKAVDITRSRARSPVPVEDPPEQRSTIGLPDRPDDGLWSAVAALPTKQRQAVAYHYLAGLPHQDVADILGGSADAARRAAADGIKALRRTYLSARQLQGDQR